MRADLHPDHLTIGFVLSNYERLLRHRIRQFHVSEPAEDCFQQIVLAMITPSDSLGTSYLERYNPSRGPAQHYVLMFAMQHMMKLHSRETNRRRIMPTPFSLSYVDSDSLSDEDSDVAESMLVDPHWNPDDSDRTIRSPEDLRQFFAGTRHAFAHSMSPSGEPRSTVYMLELMLFGGLTISEIANRLEVSAAEVHRRIKLLRKEPRVLALLSVAMPAA